MFIAILSAVLLLVVGGVVCVFWAALGDAPRWARGVARGTLILGEVVSQASKGSGKQRGGGDD